MANGEEGSLTKSSYKVGIPYTTLKKYVSKDHLKRCDVGKLAGNPSKINRDIHDVIVDILSWYDRENNGKSI